MGTIGRILSSPVETEIDMSDASTLAVNSQQKMFSGKTLSSIKYWSMKDLWMLIEQIHMEK